MMISPACAVEEPESLAIPAKKKLPPISPSESSTLRALTVILPPPPALTLTKALLVKVTSALSIPSGKLKLPFSLMVTIPASDKPPK